MGKPTLVTREAAKAALDSHATARDNDQIDEARHAATDTVESLLHVVHIDPRTATRYFDWPDENTRGTRPWRLRLGPNPLITLSAFTAGGTAITTGNLNPEPAN